MAAKFELKKSQNDKYLFNLVAPNGQVVLTSEPYESRAGALTGIESVRKNALQGVRFGRLCARNGAPYFTLKAPNGQVIGQSQMYAGEKAREVGIEAVQTHAPHAPLDDQTAAG